MILLFFIGLAAAFAIGVAEAQRVINAVHIAEGSVHARLAAIEEKLKEKL